MPKSTSFLTPKHSSKIILLLRYSLWGQSFHKCINNYLAKLLAQRRISTTSQVLLKTDLHTYLSLHLYVCLPHSAPLLLSPHTQQNQNLLLDAQLLCHATSQALSLPFSFPPTLPPAFHSLSLINAAPLLTIIYAASLLYFISHTPRERPPHAFPCSSNGKIPATKIITANKTQLNLKNLLCSH